EAGAVTLDECGIAQDDQSLRIAAATQEPVDRLGELASVEAVEIAPVVEDPHAPPGAFERGVECGHRMLARVEALVAECGGHVHDPSIARVQRNNETAGRSGAPACRGVGRSPIVEWRS